jgi:hypothetical protein
MRHDLVWQWCEGPGLEHCTATASADGIDLAGAIVADWEGRTLALQYALHCDAAWRFVRGKVRASIGGDERQVAIEHLLSSGEWRVDGRDEPALSGCEDIDLMGSPITNTLPVRRLQLAADAPQEFDVAWIVLPSLQVQRSRQEYLRVDTQRVRYRSIESGFTATLRLDDDGFVIDYPPYWRRRQ